MFLLLIFIERDDKMELNAKQRRDSIKVWLSKEERTLVEAKAEYYGYKRLAPYVRDAVIYENVTYVDLKNKEELYKAYSENTEQLKKIAKGVRHISKYATQLSSEDLKKLTNTMFGILNNQKTMMKLIDEKLDLDVWKQVNHTKLEELEDKKQCQLQKG